MAYDIRLAFGQELIFHMSNGYLWFVRDPDDGIRDERICNGHRDEGIVYSEFRNFH